MKDLEVKEPLPPTRRIHKVRIGQIASPADAARTNNRGKAQTQTNKCPLFYKMTLMLLAAKHF